MWRSDNCYARVADSTARSRTSGRSQIQLPGKGVRSIGRLILSITESNITSSIVLRDQGNVLTLSCLITEIDADYTLHGTYEIEKKTPHSIAAHHPKEATNRDTFAATRSSFTSNNPTDPMQCPLTLAPDRSDAQP